METITFKLVYRWVKYAPNKKYFQQYYEHKGRAENVQTLTFSKSSARDYKTILARLKLELGLNLNPSDILVFKNGRYTYLRNEGLQ